MHHAGPQGFCQAEGSQAELGAARETLAVSHPIFAQCFHVVHVQADHVAQAMGKEERMGARGNRLVGVSAHDAQGPHALRQGARGGQVRLQEGQPRTQDRGGGAHHVQKDSVQVGLARGKAAVHREGGGKVARVILGRTGARIKKEEPAVAHGLGAAVVVQDFAARGGDGPE